MKFILLRYNTTPITLSVDDILSITAENSILVVTTKSGHTYVGYHFSPTRI